MLQPRRDLDLVEEAVAAEGGRQLGPEHLDRHPAMVPDILGQVDGGHSAAAELAFEHVPIPQSVGEPRIDWGHESTWRGDCRVYATCTVAKRLEVTRKPRTLGRIREVLRSMSSARQAWKTVLEDAREVGGTAEITNVVVRAMHREG